MIAHRKRTQFGKDQRRKHHHFMVTIHYADGEKFARTYTDRKKAEGFAARQRQSPIVQMAQVNKVS
jgi:hypothetical protein